MFQFSFHDVNCCVSHKILTILKIHCFIFLVWIMISMFLYFCVCLGVCLYGIAELLVPRLSRDEEETEFRDSEAEDDDSFMDDTGNTSDDSCEW